MKELCLMNLDEETFTYLGASMSGTCKKLLFFCFFEGSVTSEGAGLDSTSATGACGEPKPPWIP